VLSFCAKCCNISVGATFPAEKSMCTFVLSFVCFNVASEVTEIDRISVDMHVSEYFNYGKLQLTDILLPENKLWVLSGDNQQY